MQKTLNLIFLILFVSSCSVILSKKQDTEIKDNTEKKKYVNEINQFISPNGDGKNDCWVIPELDKYPKNTLKLFNRWGNLVYEKEGYIDDFCGIPNTKYGKEKVEKDGVLPNTTYFYTIDLGDTTKEPYTGYMQISR